MYKQFAWMVYSRCGRTKALYRGTKISFVRHENATFLKYNIVLALLATVRKLAEVVNVEFTVITKPFQIRLD